MRLRSHPLAPRTKMAPAQNQSGVGPQVCSARNRGGSRVRHADRSRQGQLREGPHPMRLQRSCWERPRPPVGSGQRPFRPAALPPHRRKKQPRRHRERWRTGSSCARDVADADACPPARRMPAPAPRCGESSRPLPRRRPDPPRQRLHPACLGSLKLGGRKEPAPRRDRTSPSGRAQRCRSHQNLRPLARCSLFWIPRVCRPFLIRDGSVCRMRWYSTLGLAPICLN
jgi:hypothetical protein